MQPQSLFIFKWYINWNRNILVFTFNIFLQEAHTYLVREKENIFGGQMKFASMV